MRQAESSRDTEIRVPSTTFPNMEEEDFVIIIVR